MSARLRVPRQIRTGALATVAPGARLRCAVLASTTEEWVGVDLASGAFVRNAAGGAVPDPGAHGPLQVVDVVVGDPHEAPDPTRPEAVTLAEASEPLGTLEGRRARRLLRRLAAPEREGTPLLGRWGPSVAFEDLDGSTPSLVLVELDEDALELTHDDRGAPRCWIHWAGVRQALPVADPVAAAAAARAPERLRGRVVDDVLGYAPGFALAGLGAVQAGYVPKVLLSVLPA